MAARSTTSAARTRAAARSKPKPPPLLGFTEPRIFTPPLRPLTPETSLGFACVQFAEEVVDFPLLPWQKWLLIHMLELLPDGDLRFRYVVILVARQNGKSTLSVILSLYFMYVLGRKLVIGTAQDLDVAEEIWQQAVDLALEEDDFEEPLRPELHAGVSKVVGVNGKKALVLKKNGVFNGERYKVKAANRRGGRGMSADLILLDELREHQTWDAWGAITKTTMARAFAMIVALSNAGDASSVVLLYLRKMAHLALGDPDGINAEDDPGAVFEEDIELLDEDLEVDDLELDDEDSLGIFEWSATPGRDKRDRTGWAQANPSLGHPTRDGGGLTVRSISAACRTDPEWVFRTEVLCQWPEGTLSGPFPTGSWEATKDDESKIAKGNPITLGIDTSWDRSTTYIGMAGLREDGLPHVGIIAARAGSDWVVDWLKSDAAPPFDHIVIQAKGAPASSLIKTLKDAGFSVVEWQGSELAKATGNFYDHVRATIGEGDSKRELRRRSQPVLDIAAGTGVAKPLGDAWVWDRKKSPADVAPLIAVTAALWGLGDGKPAKKPEPRIRVIGGRR